MDKFKDGQRVKLLANEDEGWQEQFGTVLGSEDNGTYMVSLDEEYRDDKHDDGLREVDVEQLAEAKPTILLSTVDGNAFSVMGAVRAALRKAGQGDRVKEYIDKATSGDYDNLLTVSMEYVDFV